MNGYDLHCHSQASDGVLSPGELVFRAAQGGVTTLALTDHDSVAGLKEAKEAARAAGIRLIPGIELSVSWGGHCIHVLGLNIDPQSAPLQQGIAKLAKIRESRAAEISLRLEKLGLPNLWEEVCAMAGDGRITRVHFARALVAKGIVVDEKAAFERYLNPGRPAYVQTEWAKLEDALAWIRAAGGVAVLAHPGRYPLPKSRLSALLEEFRAMGGRGIEVACGNSTPERVRESAQWARDFGLFASLGSDFHTPEKPGLELGRLPQLPADLTPVWSLWE